MNFNESKNNGIMGEKFIEPMQNNVQDNQTSDFSLGKTFRSEEEEFQNYLGNRNSYLRRKTKLIKMFEKYQNLSRSEVARILNLALNTAAKDLANLEEEGIIERIRPNNSPRTHYFSLIKK